MTNLAKSRLYEIGKVLVNEDKSKDFIKQVATISNQYLNLKVVNAMIENNIYLNIVDNEVKQSYIKKLKNKKEQFQIRFIIQGKLEKLDQKTSEKIVYNENELSIEYKKNTEESLLHKQGEHVKYICITLNEHYLKENGYLLDVLKRNFCKKLYEPDLKDKLLELFDREYTSGLDKIYLKNKTMELILFALDRVQINQSAVIEDLDNEDIKRVKKAKDYIDENFHENITIALLSKKIALNQTKLKKGFKELFSKTVHEYLKDVRLTYALKYLKENRYSVKEVALKSGYTNQGSFSYAFFGKYSTLPKDILKKTNLWKISSDL